MPLPGSQDKKDKHNKKLADILAAAAQVFSEQGFDRASIRAVAERAGVSVAGLYYYVRSKEELLFQIQYHVFDDLVQRFKSESSSVVSAEERLELLVRNHLERFLANLSEFVVCSREIDRLKGDLSATLEAKRREYFAQAVRLFSELAERESWVEPRTAALALFGSINWIYTWYKPGTAPSASRMARELVRLYLRGVEGGGHEVKRA